MSASNSHGITRLAVHTVLHQLAFGICGAFSTAFLLRTGLAPAEIFLTLTAMLALRFISRPLTLLLAPRLGLRALLLIGTGLSALQYPILAQVHGVDAVLALFCLVTAVANVFYWTSYHALFSVASDAGRVGRQVGLRQVLVAGAGILGPLTGGVVLTLFGPQYAFGFAAFVELFAMLPLMSLRASPIPRYSPPGAYAGARLSMQLFATDAWIMSTAAPAWSIIMFTAVGGHYDAFGSVLAAATLGGTLGGMVLGRLIDLGRARSVVWINASAMAASLAVRVLCDDDALLVVGAAVLATLLGGLYIPTLMSAVYRETKSAPCAFRSQFAAEGSWDVSGVVASLLAAAMARLGLPLQWIIVLALPGILVQFLLLKRRFSVHSE